MAQNRVSHSSSIGIISPNKKRDLIQTVRNFCFQYPPPPDLEGILACEASIYPKFSTLFLLLQTYPEQFEAVKILACFMAKHLVILIDLLADRHKLNRWMYTPQFVYTVWKYYK